MKSPHKVWNVMLPIWMIILNPPILLPAAAICILWDWAVLEWGTRRMGKRLERPEKWNVLWRIVGCGFLADAIGIALLFLIIVMESFLPSEIGKVLTNGIVGSYDGVVGTLILFGIVAFCGWLIFCFNRRWSFAKTDWSDGQKRRMSIWLAVLTAPYSFLIPIWWIYRF